MEIQKLSNFRDEKGLSALVRVFLFSVTFLLLVNLVSAGPVEDINKVIEQITEVIKPIFENVLGTYTDSQYFFAAFLILIIIFSIVWVALDRVEFFSEHRWVLWIVSGAVSILSVRWLNVDGQSWIIETIILPYSVLGVALSAGLPFVLYFFVVNVGFSDLKYKIFRRIAWIFFAVIFIGLWISRSGQLGSFGYIYLWTAILSLIMAFLDGTIQRFMFQMKLERAGYQTQEEARREILRKIDQVTDDLTHGRITATEANRLKKNYKRQLVALQR